jgi:osmoprotectant transport system permease protein
MLSQIATASWEHLLLVLASLIAASLAGLPLAIWAHRNQQVARPLLLAIDVIQTIPSLALFGILLPLPLIGGIGARLAIFALFLYALLPIVRNTFAGLSQVPLEIRESAIAMGLKPHEILREVEAPLAAPSIVAGLRIAAVTCISTATVAAAIGAGGLGVFLYRGLATVEESLLLAGAVPAALMAIAADRLFAWIEDKLSRSVSVS